MKALSLVKKLVTVRKVINKAILGAVSMVAVEILPPLAVELVGELLIATGKGLQKIGAVVERSGHSVVNSSVVQKERNKVVITGA